MASSPRAGQAPGVVKVRLSGALPDLEALAGLAGIAARRCGGIDLIEMSPPYPNRRDAGARLYLTIRLTAGPAPRQLTAREDS